jgi:Clr5 domain
MHVHLSFLGRWTFTATLLRLEALPSCTLAWSTEVCQQFSVLGLCALQGLSHRCSISKWRQENLVCLSIFGGQGALGTKPPRPKCEPTAIPTHVHAIFDSNTHRNLSKQGLDILLFFLTMAHPKLQWNVKGVVRAPAVPAEDWENHKEELCQLREKMTLEDIMVSMKIRHRFTPS